MDFGTLTARTRTAGLSAGLEEFSELLPSGLYLELAAPDPELPRAAAALRSMRIPIVAGSVPFVRRGPGRPPWPSLADPSETVRAEAHSLTLRTAQNLGQLGCSRVVLAVGRAGLEPDPSFVRAWNAGAKAEGWLEARAAQRQERERAAERLCRELHALAKDLPRSRFLLLVEEDPGALLDLELMEAVLQELKAPGVGVVIDTGRLGLRVARGDGTLEGWIGSLRPRTGLFLFSDHDGRSRANLLLGSGRSDLDIWRSLLEIGAARDRLSNTPWVLLPDPERSGRQFLEEARALAERTFGKGGVRVQEP